MVSAADGVSVTDAVAPGVDSEADAVSVGEAVGVFVPAGDDVDLRFLRGVEVGVGCEKSLLNLSTSDSSCSCVARAAETPIAKIKTRAKMQREFLLTRLSYFSWQAPGAPPCSFEFRDRDFRVENSRSG